MIEVCQHHGHYYAIDREQCGTWQRIRDARALELLQSGRAEIVPVPDEVRR